MYVVFLARDGVERLCGVYGTLKAAKEAADEFTSWEQHEKRWYRRVHEHGDTVAIHEWTIDAPMENGER